MSDRATLALAVSTAALVPAVYGVCLPTVAEVRASSSNRVGLTTGETSAAIVAGGVVLALAVATRSPEVAAAGLAAVVGLAAAYGHARKAE